VGLGKAELGEEAWSGEAWSSAPQLGESELGAAESGVKLCRGAPLFGFSRTLPAIFGGAERGL